MPYNYQDQEFQELINTTKDVIDNFGTEIVLVRQAGFIDDGAGGQLRSGSPVSQASRRRWLQGTTEDSRFSYLVDGEEVRTTNTIVGMPDDDIQKDDTFVVDGQNYKVIWIHPFNGYEVKGAVIQIGG